jgi:hypothetical protein
MTFGFLFSMIVSPVLRLSIQSIAPILGIPNPERTVNSQRELANSNSNAPGIETTQPRAPMLIEGLAHGTRPKVSQITRNVQTGPRGCSNSRFAIDIRVIVQLPHPIPRRRAIPGHLAILPVSHHVTVNRSLPNEASDFYDDEPAPWCCAIDGPASTPSLDHRAATIRQPSATFERGGGGSES